jgi:hypothetical protein
VVAEKVTLTAEKARELLDYDPVTGILRWRVDRFVLPWRKNASAGEVAGSLRRDGYRRVSIDRKEYMSHRLAWLISHGAWPAGEIDHINGNVSDNRLCNLRDVTHAQNQRNMKVFKTNRCGLKGVTWHKKGRKWQARIVINGRHTHLGLFDTAEAANEAYVAAAKLHYGEGSVRQS